MNNNTKIFSMFLLGAILVVGTISLTIPSSFALPVLDVLKNNKKLNVDSLYIVAGPVETPQDGLAESIAGCDKGDFVISGGFDHNTAGNERDVPLSSIPTDTLDGWSASIAKGLDDSFIQAIAVCFDAQ